MSKNAPAARATLYVIVAAEAPVAVVFWHARRWWHLGAWNLDDGSYEPGAWFRGTLYPRRCEVSPDGKLLSYFALKGGGHVFEAGKWGAIYSGVSKVPWLHALALWHHDSTYHNGCYFASRSEPPQHPVAKPHEGSIARKYHLCYRPNRTQYANERRRQWVEHEDSEPRRPNDVWDERHRIVLARTQPGGRARLVLIDTGVRFNARGRIEGRAPDYHLMFGDQRVALDDAAWADWDNRGRLLIATRNGELQIRNAGSASLAIRHEISIADREPDPHPAPPRAQRW